MFCCCACLAPSAVQADHVQADDAPVPGIAQLGRLDLLPRLKSSVFVGSVSSYDRTGGNDDGFSGKYSYVAKEDGGLVVADLQGPGIIYRIWTPTPSDDVFEFYFDGEATPRIKVKFRDIFTGTQSPFEAPLVGFGAGGFYCYVPLPFAKSCKIVARAERVQFYQINYARYPDDVPIKSWTPAEKPADVRQWQQALALFGSSGKDLSQQAAPPEAACAVHAQQVSLAPGSSATLLETQSGGRIVGLRIAPASALAGKGRDLTLRITWDGEDTAGGALSGRRFLRLRLGATSHTIAVGGHDWRQLDYCYFPMPFDKSAKIELVSERTDGPAGGAAGGGRHG